MLHYLAVPDLAHYLHAYPPGKRRAIMRRAIIKDGLRGGIKPQNCIRKTEIPGFASNHERRRYPWFVRGFPPRQAKTTGAMMCHPTVASEWRGSIFSGRISR